MVALGACWRIMGKDGPETRSIARFEPVLGIVGGGSGGSFVAHFPMIGLFVVFRCVVSRNGGALINRARTRREQMAHLINKRYQWQDVRDVEILT